MQKKVTLKQAEIINSAINDLNASKRAMEEKTATLAKVVYMIVDETEEITSVKIENGVLFINE